MPKKASPFYRLLTESAILAAKARYYIGQRTKRLTAVFDGIFTCAAVTFPRRLSSNAPI
jgi:hypothetical protein